MRCCIAFSLLLAALPVCAEEPSLSFQRSGAEVKVLKTSEISAQVASGHIKFFDPRHGKVKTYRAWPVKAVMELAYGQGWTQGEHSEVVLTAMDGYASVAAAAKLAETGGFIAFEDLDVPGWEPIGRKRANPGPYYLVWTGEAQSTENAYPWPWQLVTINLVKFEERYPEVVPSGARPGSPAARGFTIFKNRCLRCHAINRQGGTVGPDLNAPKPLVSYRSKSWIKSYVKRPSAWRYTEMPDHQDLTDRDLDDLYAYFRHKSRQPEKQ